MQTIKVPQLAWYGPKDFEMEMPDKWQVEMCYMQGYNRPTLKPQQIKAAIQKPIGVKPLREMAKGKKEVVIVFDDMTRVTRAAKIVPFILEELAAAGIPDDNIRFICGLALHGALYRQDFVKKLGEDVVSRFKVFNHNAFGNCVYVGTTSIFKTRVYINEEYMKCDLKILIGSVVPHPCAGFGGGSKLIMPGVTGFETINFHHKLGGARIDPVCAGAKPNQAMGIMEGSQFRKDLEEAAGLAGIDFMVNAINNLWGEPAAIYAGHWQKAFAAAVEDGKTHYRTPVCADKDIVISNSYAKASESMISLAAGIPLVTAKGGEMVIIANAPEGQVTHYLVGPFGKTTYALQYTQCKIPDNINKIISFTEYPHPGSSWFEPHEKIVYMNKWAEVLKTLKAAHKGSAKVGVIPDATNQYFGYYDL